MSGISSSSRPSPSKSNFVQPLQEEDITSPSLIADSMSTDWTDEKHRLFLNSMEASFVKRLRSHENRPVGSLHWNSRVEDLLSSESSQQLIGSNDVHDSQNFNVNRARPQLDNVHESHVLLENQWIRRFRSTGNPQEVRSTNLQNGGHSSEVIHSGGGKITPFGISNSRKKLPTRQCPMTPIYLENSLDSHGGSCFMDLEVSDQNFEEENQQGENLSSPRSTNK